MNALEIFQQNFGGGVPVEVPVEVPPGKSDMSALQIFRQNFGVGASTAEPAGGEESGETSSIRSLAKEVKLVGKKQPIRNNTRKKTIRVRPRRSSARMPPRRPSGRIPPRRPLANLSQCPSARIPSQRRQVRVSSRRPSVRISFRKPRKPSRKILAHLLPQKSSARIPPKGTSTGVSTQRPRACITPREPSVCILSQQPPANTTYPQPPAPLKTETASLCKALCDLRGKTTNELSLTKDEAFHIIKKREPGWWLIKRVSGNFEQGWAPSACLREEQPVKSILPLMLESPPIGIRVSRSATPTGDEIPYIALYDFSKVHENEMSLSKGEVVFVTKKHPSKWWLVKKKLDSPSGGWVPAEYLREMPVTETPLPQTKPIVSKSDEEIVPKDEGTKATALPKPMETPKPSGSNTTTTTTQGRNLSRRKSFMNFLTTKKARAQQVLKVPKLFGSRILASKSKRVTGGLGTPKDRPKTEPRIESENNHPNEFLVHVRDLETSFATLGGSGAAKMEFPKFESTKGGEMRTISLVSPDFVGERLLLRLIAVNGQTIPSKYYSFQLEVDPEAPLLISAIKNEVIKYAEWPEDQSFFPLLLQEWLLVCHQMPPLSLDGDVPRKVGLENSDPVTLILSAQFN